MSDIDSKLNKYGKYPFDLYGILESLKGNDKSAYTAVQAFDQIEALIQEQVIAELEKLKSQNVAIPCEPDCTPIRHARHEGAWEQHLEFDDFIDERIKELKGDK